MRPPLRTPLPSARPLRVSLAKPPTRSPTHRTMSVSEYIEKTELASKVEAAVNEAVKARPDEPLSFLVRMD